MRIGCITRHSYPTAQEIRVTKFAATVSAKGNTFFVFCPSSDNQALIDPFEYGEIVRLRPWPANVLGKLLFAPLPINPIWFCWLFLQFRARALDLVIVRDLRLALPAFCAARVCGIKAILDLGEHYPGMMDILGKQTLAHHFTRNRWLIARLESMSVKCADRVWVVVDENRQRLSRYSANIEVINNYPALPAAGAEYRSAQRPFSSTDVPVTVVSFGLIDNIRGLDLAIDAFAIVARDLGNVRLLIYGDGFFCGALKKQVKDLGLSEKVLFGGWVSEERKYKLLAEGDIGLILHKVCDLTHHTVPNKLFDYMCAGLPIVATQLRPVARILETEQCGIAVNDNPSDVAAALKLLILDLDKRRQFANNGYLAARSRYTWASEAAKIITDIKTLTGCRNESS